MSDDPLQTPSAAQSTPIAAAVKRTALGALLAGGVCLYFGFTWFIDAPGSASEKAESIWYAADHAFRWGLRITGVAFLLVAGLAWTGSRGAALLATFVEAVFALLMVAMAVETFLEARADGHFDPTVILLLIIMAIAISAARHSWRLYTGFGQPPATE